MLQTNGIQPKLEDHTCEELICQQYWHQGKLANEVDVLAIKANGRWHQLYFDSGTVFWRSIDEAPTPFEHKTGDVDSYPFIDLGEKYQLKDHLITNVSVEPFPDGAKVTIEFEKGDTFVLYHQENKTNLRHISY